MFCILFFSYNDKMSTIPDLAFSYQLNEVSDWKMIIKGIFYIYKYIFVSTYFGESMTFL